jgi:hypothetical protein
LVGFPSTCADPRVEMEAEMTLALASLVGLVRWRRSRKRICREAAKLLAEDGDQAFFQAAKLAWKSQGDGDDCQARYWQAVCGEVSRQIQRKSIAKWVHSPEWQRTGSP